MGPPYEKMFVDVFSTPLIFSVTGRPAPVFGVGCRAGVLEICAVVADVIVPVLSVTCMPSILNHSNEVVVLHARAVPKLISLPRLRPTKFRSGTCGIARLAKLASLHLTREHGTLVRKGGVHRTLQVDAVRHLHLKNKLWTDRRRRLHLRVVVDVQLHLSIHHRHLGHALARTAKRRHMFAIVTDGYEQVIVRWRKMK